MAYVHRLAGTRFAQIAGVSYAPAVCAVFALSLLSCLAARADVFDVNASLTGYAGTSGTLTGTETIDTVKGLLTALERAFSERSESFAPRLLKIVTSSDQMISICDQSCFYCKIPTRFATDTNTSSA